MARREQPRRDRGLADNLFYSDQAPRRRTQISDIIVGVGPMDMTLLVVILFLVLIGIIMVFSASYSTAVRVFGNPVWFLWRNIAFALIGFVVMMAASYVSYFYVKAAAVILYSVSVILLMLLFFQGIMLLGATRWLELPFTDFTFQPSEVARAGLIFFIAYIFDRFPNALSTWASFGLVTGVVGLVVLFIFAADYGSAVVLTTVGCGLILMHTPKFWKHLGVYIGGAIALVGGLWIVMDPMRRARVTTFFAMMFGGEDADVDVLVEAFQITQSRLAIASGGTGGVGLGASMQSTFLPEAYNDFIFAIIIEEIGLIGGGLVMMLFLILLWRGIVIARHAPDTFSSLSAIGISFSISLQAIINIGVTIGVLPTTGITLPFISYGGTSLIRSMALIGVLLNISRYTRMYDVQNK